jgi:uncharacterized membrane protein
VSRIRNLLEGLWLVPGIVALALALLGLVLVEVDETSDVETFTGEADAARVVLSVVAGSLITVAGLAFSITVLTLQLVSSQYTPRAVRSLMGDRTNQIVAGAFVGIFAYCLVVLRSVQEDEVPSIAVTGAIVLGLGGLALLLVFIHHFGQSIKVDEICARIARETMAATDRLYPEGYGEPQPIPDAFVGEPAMLAGERAGWVRAIALDRLAGDLDRARSIEVLVVPGDFVTPSTPLAAIRPADAADGRGAAAFEIARERDLQADVGFGIRQLADIAVRALSPGVNDPTTAVTCIGYLGAIVERLAGRRTPDADRRFGDGPVVRAPGATFERLLGEAFLEIGRHGQDDPRVVAAALDALERVGLVAITVGAEDRLLAVKAVVSELAGPAIERARTDRERTALGIQAARLRDLA